MHFVERTLDKLTIDDDRSLAHVGVYRELKRILVRDGFRFLVPDASAPSRARTWDRVLLLNLTFWNAHEPADLLVTDHVPADAVCHAAWHHLARKALAGARPTPQGLFLGESIASAFDIYLVGRVLGHAPESEFLETQVPAMAERAEAAGVDHDAFEAMLQGVVAEPERAFEDLRELLFDATLRLYQSNDLQAASAALAAFDGHRFGCLLHHFELSNWVLYARAYAAEPADASAAIRIDAALRAAPVALEWLEQSWVAGAIAPT